MPANGAPEGLPKGLGEVGTASRGIEELAGS